jgi:hypothetical protein
VNTRRQFLITAPLGLMGAASACRRQEPGDAQSAATQQTPGAPVAFGTARPTGPEVTAATFAEAERLVQVSYTDADRATMVAAGGAACHRCSNAGRAADGAAFRHLAPGMVWNPCFQRCSGCARASCLRPGAEALPSNDDDIAFAPVAALSR